jgi:hypothetical protein
MRNRDLEYVRDLIHQLADLTRKSGFRVLTTMLETAESEADHLLGTEPDQKRGVRNYFEN